MSRVDHQPVTPDPSLIQAALRRAVLTVSVDNRRALPARELPSRYGFDDRATCWNIYWRIAEIAKREP